MIEFDLRLGTPGLHHVGSSVRALARTTVLPPDLFARFEREAFYCDRLRSLVIAFDRL
jgi:sulfotransferase